MSLVGEYVNHAPREERLYGFTAGTVHDAVTSYVDRIYIKLWADSREDAVELLPRVGAALYRCAKGSRPIREGIP